MMRYEVDRRLEAGESALALSLEHWQRNYARLWVGEDPLMGSEHCALCVAAKHKCDNCVLQQEGHGCLNIYGDSLYSQIWRLCIRRKPALHLIQQLLDMLAELVRKESQ